MGSFFTSKNEKIVLEKNPIAKAGGEGAVYKIKSPSIYAKYCAKIYHKERLGGASHLREKKIQYMLQNLPNIKNNNRCKICWTKEILYKKSNHKKFRGFIMPLAHNNSIQLYDLCQLNTKKLSGKWNDKYGRDNILGLINRMKLCVNIASGVSTIHNMGSYTIVDLKPQNILVTIDGNISMIDLDSIQINDPKDIQILNASVSTPGYVPPEGKTKSPSQYTINETWDRFSIAVIFYEILFGIHPFCVTPKHGNQTTIHEFIQSGLFPFGKNRKEIKVIPPPHNKFKKLPHNFQKLFINTFDIGLNQPSKRTSVGEWGKAFFQELNKLPKNYTSKYSKKNTQNTIKTPNDNTQQPDPKVNIPVIKTGIKQQIISNIIKPKTKLTVRHTSFEEVLKYQFFARGLHKIDINETLPRKNIYFYSFIYSTILLIGCIVGIEFLYYSFFQFTMLLGFFISHIIGSIDAIGTFILCRKN